MAQFQKGATFQNNVPGDCTAEKLHQLVEAMTALPGLISEQTLASRPAVNDFLLILQAATGQLRKVDLASLFLPPGIEVPYGGTTAPDGWLLAYGQEVSRTEYAALFAIYGTSNGAGDGATTFNLPDYRGRAPFGKDNMGGSAAGRLTAGAGIDGAVLGASGGTDTVTLTTSQLPEHAHGMGGLTVTGVNFQNNTPNDGAQARMGSITLSNGVTYSNANSASGLSGNTANAGSGDAHSNLPPGIVRNWIIKT